MGHRALIVMMLVASAPLSAQLKPVPAPSKADRANVERLERSLAPDSMEGRGTAKPGSTKAARFLANMAGEETGLIGTNWFIAHPNVPLAQIVAGFETEMIGRPDSLAGGPGTAWLTGYERSTMGDML